MSERVESDGKPSPPASRAIAMFAVVFLVLALIGAAAWFIGGSPAAEERFCPADGRLGPNGQTYGRDPDQDCLFVDEAGVPLPDQ